jgi:hypothetical protein
MFERDLIKQGLKRAVRQIRRQLPLKVKPDWRTLLQSDSEAWRRCKDAAQDGPRVLIATSTGGHAAVATLESLLAVGLTIRGARVQVLLCDEYLPACLQTVNIEYWRNSSFVKHGPQRDLCGPCYETGSRIYEPLGLPILRYSELVSPAERTRAAECARTLDASDIAGYVHEGLPVGEHALAGALKYVARGTLDGEPLADAILRRYFEAALVTVYATRALLRSNDFSAVCVNHGIYVPPGLIAAVAREQQERVVTWNPAYRRQCFIFSHDDTYHRTLMTEPTTTWERLAWTQVLENKVMAYLKNRWRGTDDWIWFHDQPNEDLPGIAAETGANFSKASVGMLTNVVWDAQLHYPSNVFQNMLDWVLQTVRYFVSRPDLQLIVRVHPAEIRGWLPSRQPVVEEIRRVFPELPDNIIIIPPQSQISTYAVMSQCDSVVIYGTKTGVELTSLGIPVIVAGEAWIRGKGISMDPRTADEYFRMLDRLPLGQAMDEEIVQRARKYAYHFFFRRMIPLSMTRPVSGWPPYEIDISGLDGLRPGRDPGLDVVCAGILHGTEFVYDELPTTQTVTHDSGLIPR